MNSGHPSNSVQTAQTNHLSGVSQNAGCKCFLLILIVAAVSLRFYWITANTPVIENEGAEYARIAENLLNRHEYVGVMDNGPQLNFPPLYPLMIAASSLLTGQSETGGRLVSSILGTCLILPVFLISSHIYGRKAALVSASLVAFHPILVSLSSSVYAEGPYLTFMMGGIYCGVRALEYPNSKYSLFSGLSLGLAYLTRPEAIIYPLLITSAILVVGFIRKKLKAAVLSCFVLLMSFGVLALPYIASLSFQTGHIRLEGKGTINYAIGQRMNLGMSYLEAGYGVDENANGQGIHLRPNLSVLRSTSVSPRDIPHYFVLSVKRNIKDLFHTLAESRSLGSPIVILLGIVGLFRSAWDTRRLIHETFLSCVVLAVFLILLSVQRHDFRNYFSLLPFLILWASKGIEELADWARATYKESCLLGGWKYVRGITEWALSVALLLFALGGVLEGVSEFDQARSLPLKEAGLWLREYMPGPKKIMETGTVIPFYASGSWMPLPYAESPLALRYIEKKNPDFIVVRGSSQLQRPFLTQWLEAGVPHKNARLVFNHGNTTADKVMIYHWESSATDRSLLR